MSSTNRSDSRLNHKFDYYNTPEWIINEFIDYIIRSDNDDHINIVNFLKNGKCLDPCAGGSNDNPESFMPYHKIINEKFNNDILTIDIREDSLAKVKLDFINTKLNEKYDIIISNPPFNMAEEFIKKSYDLLNDNGYVIFLLRIGFLGSRKRFDMFSDIENFPSPAHIMLSHKRPSFTDDGKTDSDYYAHMIFRKSNPINYKKFNSSNLFII